MLDYMDLMHLDSVLSLHVKQTQMVQVIAGLAEPSLIFQILYKQGAGGHYGSREVQLDHAYYQQDSGQPHIKDHPIKRKRSILFG